VDISNLSSEQADTFKKIEQWIINKDGPSEFRLWGYAGTGKTYLMQIIVKWMIEEKRIVPFCCAPTGKAMSVLRSKMPPSAPCSTLHSLIYAPTEPSTLALQNLKSELAMLLASEDASQVANQIKTIESKIQEEKARLKEIKVGFTMRDRVEVGFKNYVICDEASMPTDRHRDDLLSTGARVIWVGDPEQLPPIGGKEWFGMGTPDAFLKNIQRQASESPIIRLSLDIRNGNVKKSEYQFDNCRIVPPNKVHKEHYSETDQILCGMNRTRRRFNRQLRKELGREGVYPVEGDKLICLRNEKYKFRKLCEDNVERMTPIRLINGIQCVASSNAYTSEEDDEMKYFVDVFYEDENLDAINFYHRHFLLNYDEGSDEEELTFDERKKMREFDYAYAVTVHKAQGSEWPDVTFFDDNFARYGKFANKETRRRFVYTAVTRAKDRLTWITT